MNEQPSRHNQFDQSGQTVHGNQTNIAGDLNTTWPRVAIIAAIVALLVFTLLLIEVATNQIARLSGLSLQTLLVTAAVIASLTWGLAFWMLRSTPPRPAQQRKRRKNQTTPTQHRFTGRSRHLAKALAIGLPILAITVSVAYYAWRILPARYTTILLADFLNPSGVDEALVTQTLAEGLRGTLDDFPTLRVIQLHHVINPDGGSEEAQRLGALPQHKATIVIWGNYTIVAGDPEVHLHFDIIQPVDTYLKSGFAASYGPSEISQLLQISQPTMFDFKLPLGDYLGQMSAFTVGLMLFSANRNQEAIPFFKIAGRTIGQPLAEEFERSIRLYRGTNYLHLGLVKEAKPDLSALVPDLTMPVVPFDDITLTAIGNLGVVLLEQGDYTAAKAAFERAAVVYEQLGNQSSQAEQLNNLGAVALQQGDQASAKATFMQALTLYEHVGDLSNQASILNNLGVLLGQQGNYSAAKASFERALSIHEQLGNLPNQAEILCNLGIVLNHQGDHATAQIFQQRALTLFEQLGNPLGQARSLNNLGMVAKRQADYASSKLFFERALTLFEQLGNPLGQAQTVGNLGMLALDQNDPTTARAYLDRSAALYQSMNLPIDSAFQAGLDALDAQ